MAEGDTILRAAGRIEAALGGERVRVRAPHPRGRATGVTRLDGRVLTAAHSRGKHLLLDFGDLVLHSHLGMSGSWHVYRAGARWRRAPGSAWAVLSGAESEAVQWGGPTLRVLRAEQVVRDPVLARLGPDILAADFDPEAALASLRGGSPQRQIGEVLLDQSLVAGIGNIFKSEGCFAARVDPWTPLGDLDDRRLAEVLLATRGLMEAAVRSGRQPRTVYRRAGQACRSCGGAIRSKGQGDANRTTYWCPRCQA